MKLLEDLRRHILSLPGEIKIDPDDLLTFADDGRIISAAEGTNPHFELAYKANLIIQNLSASPDQLFYWLLLWLAQNLPNHKEDAIKWQADLLNQTSTDLSISIELTEIIKVETTAEGIKLKHCGLPKLEPELLTAKNWSLYLLPESTTTPIAQWVQGG